MPIRFSHKDLQIATNNFTTKLGKGGFGSVYEGVLPAGTQLAVKQLEGLGQGKTEFQAEVSSIGSIHHLHLVRLKGFCTEDDNFLAKVSDFGLAKLISREQSHVFTTLRGTRGYLAPEWITNYAISDKCDVYSYGMVLLEIIGGRKNYDTSETEEKCHFPSYAFKMMEQGKLKDILDVKLQIAEDDERVSIAIKVGLRCLQYDMHLRPSMTKVVQMLEQVSPVPPPPSSQQMNSHIYLSSFKSTSEHSTSLEPLNLNSCADFSAVRLSGPR
uniref:Uncharacterized protein n=1 Tax=Daucus carota subsp. sativus TaxID=79200 RepID=A0A175YN22_DAUCS